MSWISYLPPPWKETSVPPILELHWTLATLRWPCPSLPSRITVDKPTLNTAKSNVPPSFLQGNTGNMKEPGCIYHLLSPKTDLVCHKKSDGYNDSHKGELCIPFPMHSDIELLYANLDAYILHKSHCRLWEVDLTYLHTAKVENIEKSTQTGKFNFFST